MNIGQSATKGLDFTKKPLKGLEIVERVNDKCYRYRIGNEVVTNSHIWEYLQRHLINSKEELILKINNMTVDNLPICQFCNKNRCSVNVHSLHSPFIN